MSGFSAEWLALREPSDHRARNRALLSTLQALFRARDALEVVDLGCGTGSNLRACAPFLPIRQRWRLVDHDPALLAEARDRLAAWAEAHERAGEGLCLTVGGRHIEVAFVRADLSAGAEPLLDRGADLITAAALFDLVSRDWIERFAAAVAARRAVFYTALTYDGREEWRPPHPSDRVVFAAFHAHQGRDKGFGPAAGPRASAALAKAFRAQRYVVEEAESPWRLGPKDRPLIRELARGIAAAARETGLVPEAELSAWREARSSGASCLVGHTDLLARPA